MKLNLFTDLGLRTLMRLAGNPEHSFSTQDLASELRVSRNHLVKVVGRMSKAGFVTSKRGKQGGVSLARPAEEIRVGDVVAELEKDTRLVECFRPDGGKCTLSPACRLRVRLRNAEGRFIEELNQSSLEDIAYLV